MSAAAFVFAIAGFAALAMAMGRHGEALMGRAPSHREALGLRLAACALLGTSLAFSAAWLGSPGGFVGWVGILNAAALTVALSLTVVKRLRRK